MNAFHVCGAVLALWALVVSALGITRENFPGSAGAERLVGAISIVLVVLTLGSAIVTSGSPEHEEGEREAAALAR